MAAAYPVYNHPTAPGLAQFLDADTCKVGILQTVGDTYVGGKLGVGTLTPATLGHFASGASGGTILTLEQAYGDADAPDLTIKKARGTLAAPTVITTADDLGVLSFAGYSGAGGYVVGAAIKGTSEGTIATTRVPGRLTFWTGTDAAPTVLTERMRITSDGKVGFGTTAPANPFNFRYSGAATHKVVGINRNNSDTAAWYLGDSGASDYNGILATNNSDLLIGHDVGGTFTETMRVKASGVAGTAGNVTFSRNITITGTMGVGANPTGDYTAAIQGSGTAGLVTLKNTLASSYTEIAFLDDANAQRGAIGVANSTSNVALRGHFYFQAGATNAMIFTHSIVENMRIATDGKVGIGTASPAYRLSVESSASQSATLGVCNTTADGFSALRFLDQSRTGKAGWGYANSGGADSTITGRMYFQVDSTSIDTVFSAYTGSNPSPVLLMIKGDGKVGIGLTSPTAVLHLKAGTTAASTAPLKLTSGDLMTAPEAGAIEFLSDKFYGTITTGTVRSAFVFETRSVSTGTGLSGGGDLSANRTLTLDQAVVPTWTGAHTFTGGVTFKNHSAFAGSGFIPETRAVQTTTVTPAVLWTKTLADDTLYWVEVRVIGRDTAGVERAYYGRTFYVYRQSAGSATLGNVIELFSEETDADWDVGVNVNTNDVEVKVTGKSSVTINWAGTVTMQAVSGNT